MCNACTRARGGSVAASAFSRQTGTYRGAGTRPADGANPAANDDLEALALCSNVWVSTTGAAAWHHCQYT